MKISLRLIPVFVVILLIPFYIPISKLFPKYTYTIIISIIILLTLLINYILQKNNLLYIHPSIKEIQKSILNRQKNKKIK